MRNLLLFLVVVLASCKDPLPVYFDKPIGIHTDSFPESMRGNYYPMEEIVDKGIKSYEEKFCIKNERIVIRDTSSAVAPENHDSEREPAASIPQVVEENNFYKIAALNSLSFSHIDSTADMIDKESKIIFAFIKISNNKISLIIRDSSANNHEARLLELNEWVKLTRYSDDYYLNLKTPFGWEYLKIESWNKGEFLNMVPFYFTSYNDKTGDVQLFLKSTAAIYPDLKPIYNDAHLIIGLKAISDPKIVKEKFKNSESNFELLKVK